VEFPVGTGSFKTQIKQGGNAQSMNMNWFWALPGLASFDKAHFLIACQLFTLFKYVSSDEHVSPETDTQMHMETHMCTRRGCRDESVGRIMSGHSCARRAESNEHPSAWALTHSWHGPCRRAGSPQNNFNAGSAQRHGNVSTRQEPCASPVPLLICGTWNCLSAR